MTRSHRAAHPDAAADDLALCHQDIAKGVAANQSCRTGRPRQDLEQIGMVGIIMAARRYANSEVSHFLRDVGFLVKVTPVGGCCSLGTASCRTVVFDRELGCDGWPCGPDTIIRKAGVRWSTAGWRAWLQKSSSPTSSGLEGWSEFGDCY